MGELADLFDKTPAGPVTFQGLQVVRALRLNVESNVVLWIRLEAFFREPRQAITISLHGARGSVNGFQGNQFILWADQFRSDKSPVRIEVDGNREGAYINVWNSWVGKSGSTDAWLMDSGMILTKMEPNMWAVKCSDGIGPPDFNSLVFSCWLEQ